MIIFVFPDLIVPMVNLRELYEDIYIRNSNRKTSILSSLKNHRTVMILAFSQLRLTYTIGLYVITSRILRGTVQRYYFYEPSDK